MSCKSAFHVEFVKILKMNFVELTRNLKRIDKIVDQLFQSGHIPLSLQETFIPLLWPGLLTKAAEELINFMIKTGSNETYSPSPCCSWTAWS